MTPEACQTLALAALRALREALPPRLGAAFDALEARAPVLGAKAPGYFLHPLALPVLQLPVWVGGPPERVTAAVEAAALGYLAVRAQDDLLDEGEGDPGEVMLLSDALLMAHSERLAVAGGAEILRYSRGVWQGYQEAMLLERALHRGELSLTAEVEAQLHERAGPLVLSPAALLGPGPERAVLEGHVKALAAAHQLQVDLADVEKDLGQGNTSLALARLGSPSSRDVLRRRLLMEGGLDAVLAEADAGFAALEAACGGRWPGLAEYAARRRRVGAEMKETVVGAYLRALLG